MKVALAVIATVAGAGRHRAPATSLLPAAPRRGPARPTRDPRPAAGTTTRRSPRSWVARAAGLRRRRLVRPHVIDGAVNGVGRAGAGRSAAASAPAADRLRAQLRAGRRRSARSCSSRSSPSRSAVPVIVLAAEARSPDFPLLTAMVVLPAIGARRHRARVAAPASSRPGWWPPLFSVATGALTVAHPRRVRARRRRLPDGREDHLDRATSTSPGTSASTASRSSSSS